MKNFFCHISDSYNAFEQDLSPVIDRLQIVKGRGTIAATDKNESVRCCYAVSSCIPSSGSLLTVLSNQICSIKLIPLSLLFFKFESSPGIPVIGSSCGAPIYIY